VTHARGLLPTVYPDEFEYGPTQRDKTKRVVMLVPARGVTNVVTCAIAPIHIAYLRRLY